MNGERGFGTAAWMVGIALVVLPLALVTLSLPRWYERTDVARAVAQDVARTVARAGDLGVGLDAAATTAKAAAAAAGLSVEADCASACLHYRVEGRLDRGESITVSVTVDLPGMMVPLVGTITPGSWTAVHSERIDDFRSLP